MLAFAYHSWQATYTRIRSLPRAVGGCPGAKAMVGRILFLGLLVAEPDVDGGEEAEDEG